MRLTTIKQYQTPPKIDIDRIRKLAGNENLAESEVFDFPKFIICRSGRNHNATDITGEGQRAAVDAWIGKPIYFKDHETKAANQIGRIYETWIEEENGETVTYGRGFGVKTEDLADIYKRIQNRIHSEMSCAYNPQRSLCSTCKADINLETNQCVNGHIVGNGDTYALDMAFTPDHVSFVGRPAVDGAGLVSNSTLNAIRLYAHGDTTSIPGVDPDTMQDLARLSTAAKDGEEFRAWASEEFSRWYALSNADATTEEIHALCDKLSAKEMIRLGRIERERFNEVIPDGKQITQAASEETDVEDSPLPEYKSVQDIFKNRGK